MPFLAVFSVLGHPNYGDGEAPVGEMTSLPGLIISETREASALRRLRFVNLVSARGTFSTVIWVSDALTSSWATFDTCSL